MYASSSRVAVCVKGLRREGVKERGRMERRHDFSSGTWVQGYFLPNLHTGLPSLFEENGTIFAIFGNPIMRKVASLILFSSESNLAKEPPSP